MFQVCSWHILQDIGGDIGMDQNGAYISLILQYKSVIALAHKAQNWLKGEFFNGSDFPTEKLMGYNTYNCL